MWDTDLIDRDTGILNKKQRKYLAGEIDLESEYKNPQKQDNLFRYRIRSKVEQSLFDFILLNRHLHEEDWQKIYEEYEDTVRDYRAEANHTDEVPDIQDNTPSEILLATQNAFEFIFKAIASVAGQEVAISVVEESIENNIRRNNIMNTGEFYYGSVTTEVDDFEDNSVVLDVAYERLEEAIEEVNNKIKGSEDKDTILRSCLIVFTKKVPEMSPFNFLRLIDSLYQTDRLDKEDYEELRPIASEIAHDVKRPQISEAIEVE